MRDQSIGMGSWTVGCWIHRVIEDDPLLQQLNAADNLQMDLYGDTIYQNDGLHLGGGVENYGVWRWRWSRVYCGELSTLGCATCHRSVPKGKASSTFWPKNSEGERLCQWNAARVVIFPYVILQPKPNMNAKQTKKVIEQQLDMWEEGRFKELCNEMINKE